MEKRKDRKPEAVQRGHFREIEAVEENPDAEPAPPCAAAKTAIIIYGNGKGTTLSVCTDNDCPVHDPRAAAEKLIVFATVVDHRQGERVNRRR